MRHLLFAAIFIAMGCASVSIPDFRAHITLPASGDGYYVKTASDEEGRIPKKEWEKLKSKGIVLLSEDYAILRNTLIKNCLTNECSDVIGVLDGLFYTLDEAFKKVNAIKKK